MSNYSFCKKNGTIKERYRFPCRQIVLAKMEHKKIMRGRHEEIVEEYDCYTIQRIELYSSKKYNYLSKVEEICKNFGVEARAWYSHNDISIDLLGENVPDMIETISKLLGGDIHIRQTV